jgi:hypothetical protein
MGLLNQSARQYYEGPDGVQNSGDESYGSYQFTSLENIINQFIIAYVGEDKLIPKIKKTDVSFHAKRALQELSFDTFKSCKSMELEVPNTLSLPLPQDYVNYVKVSWVDSAGVYRPLYPMSKTSNPKAFQQNTDGSLKFENNTYQATPADPFQEYGITKSGKSSAFDGDGLIKSDNPLEQYKKEIRVAFDTSGTGNLKYGPTLFQNNSNERVSHGMFIQLRESHDISVGMSVIGPGIPNGATIHAINSIAGSNAFPYNVTLSTPEYEQWLLGGQVGANTYAPTITASQVRFDNEELIFANLNKTSDTKTKYKSAKTVEKTVENYDYDTDMYDLNRGQRYGLDPQHAQTNGSYYIDCMAGIINFSSNISGKTVIIEYISDTLGTDSEMKVHKFAEEAMYKCIAYAILSTRANVQEYIVQRFKRDRFASVRTAKLRLSNLKLEELTQILRGKSKQIKH